MGFYYGTYPVFKDQESIWKVIEKKKTIFIDACKDINVPEEVANEIIQHEYEEIQEIGIIGSYYLLYNAFEKAEMTKDDVGELEYFEQTALKYILGFLPKIDNYLYELNQYYNGDFDRTDYLHYLYSSRTHKLYIEVAQSKYKQLNIEVENLLMIAENVWDIVNKHEYEQMLNTNNPKLKDAYHGLSVEDGINKTDINIKGKNKIGKKKNVYRSSKVVSEYKKKWKVIHEILNNRLSHNIKDYVRYAFEVYLENGDLSNSAKPQEHPVLSIYIDKRLVLSQDMESVRTYISFFDSMCEADVFNEDVSIDKETIKQFNDDIPFDTSFKTLLSLPVEFINEYLFEEANSDVHTLLNDQVIYKETDSGIETLDIDEYDVVYTSDKKIDKDGFVKYAVIDFNQVDQFLDKYISDSDKGVLYNSLDDNKDIQFFMYIMLNILDGCIDMKEVENLYNNKYNYDTAIEGLITLRAIVEGIEIEN